MGLLFWPEYGIRLIMHLCVHVCVLFAVIVSLSEFFFNNTALFYVYFSYLAMRPLRVSKT